MPDDKKKKPAPAPEKTAFEAIGGVVAIGFVVIAWPNIVVYLKNTFSFLIPGIGSAGAYASSLWTNIKHLVDWVVVVCIPLSLFLVIGIIYCVERLKILREKEAVKHDLKVEPAYEEVSGQGNRDLSVRWKKVTDLMGSANENDWKQAILESDTMLDDVLTGLGYQGESMGEKFKRVAPGDFKNLEGAQEAHGVRNRIAHDGGAFQLTHYEAAQTISKYRRVFEEFYYI